MQTEFKKTRDIELFGKCIRAKNYDCSLNGCPYREKEKMKLQLSICPTFYCGGHCPFCVAAENKGAGEFLDPKKLEKVLQKLKEKDIVRGISITGGEPFTDIELLNEIVEMIYDIFGIEMEISINTSGSGLREMHRIKRLPLVDALHISRHHDDEERNRAYFCTEKGVIPGNEELKEILSSVYDPHQLVFNCLLLKNGISTKEDMLRFLEFSSRCGVPKTGFITAMPVNQYTRENQVSYLSLFDHRDPRLLFTKDFKDFEHCHCQDGVYVTGSGKLVEFYGRETSYGCGDYVRGMVYGPDNHLRTGYGKEAEILI